MATVRDLFYFEITVRQMLVIPARYDTEDAIEAVFCLLKPKDLEMLVNT